MRWWNGNTLNSNMGGLEFKSRSQPILAVIVSWLPSVIKANVGLHFHYHGPFDHYSSNSYIINIKYANLTKKHNYTTIKMHGLLVVHPKSLRLDMTKNVKHFWTSGKMLLSEHKKLICLKQKDWSKRGVPATSARCPDHLSRQFLITASTFPCALKIPQTNIFTFYRHASPL